MEVSECDSLKNIVPVECQNNTDEIELLKFPELRFLKLQSLSEFIGFYPIEEKKELLHEKVEISKLERMELSSIPIDKIWSDHSSQRSSFEKLTHLDVNGCYKLKYLLSYSVAKSLSSLQSLFVSECEKMTSIFPDCSQMEGSIFLKLKNIKLRGMKSLSEIWNSKLPSDSFCKLDTLIIEECDKLVSVFPCYKKGTFRSLCNLRVTNCRLMQAIFNIREQVRDVSNLQDVHLEMLPNLEHVWHLNEKQGGINLNNLQKIWVEDCDSLENIFPFPVAKCLDNLEYLVACNCSDLREIVAKGEAASTDKFDLPKLRTIKFSKLPRLTSFYPGPGAYELSCLNDLSIELCDQLEPFNKETVDAQRKLAHFPEKVINKLKSMQIESWHVQSPNSYMGKNNHRRDNLEELCLSGLNDTEILYSFLHRNPNLKSLTLNDCSFEEMVPPERRSEIDNLGVIPKLKTLKLIDLRQLKDIGFDADIILGRIEFLILKNCPDLVTVVPPSVSLTHLTNLEVAKCYRLKNLMSASTAKSLGQLNTMKVINCESLVEIVGKDGENDGRVVFKQLKALELVSLRSLECFSSSDSCGFEFPSLEKLVVSACNNMEIFSKKVTRPPMLQNIYVGHEKEKKTVSWDGDLNATVQKIFKEKKFFEGMDEMHFSNHPELQQAWQGEFDLQKSWFYSLKILKLENCEIQPCAIPSHILPYLKSLKELIVHDCDKVEVIFDMNVTEGAGHGTTIQLQKLTLKSLPNLRQVWERNDKGAYNFQNLQAVVVQYCDNLQNVFPAAVAKNLKKLDHIVIGYCEGLLEIVGREGNAAADVTQKFVFPCLTMLDLVDLPELIYFYPESFTLECPVLDQLFVLGCRKLVQYESANRKPPLLGLKDFSNLEELSLNWNYALVLRSKLRELTGKLEYLNHIKLLFDSREINLGELTDILQKAPNIKEMIIEHCRFPKIVRTQIPKIDEMLPSLKILTLVNVLGIQSIGSEDSPWLSMICEKLCQLFVDDCLHLNTLVHSTTAESFSNLRELYIYNCCGLNHLFTASAAEKLKRLESIEVCDCTSIKEIVAEDETTSRGIILEFKWLYHISLNSLSSLECFYSGKHTLQLPSLIEVDILDCPNMEIFSRGKILLNSSFRGMKTPYNSNDELFFYHDLNSSVNLMFLQQFFKAVDKECFSDNLELQVGLPDKLLCCLCNLVTLKLHDCTLPYAIPFSILSYFKKLEKLTVGYSKVEVIFDMDNTEITETTQNYLVFRNLKEVDVMCCGNLQTLFPASLAKNLKELEKLEIVSCHKLLAIVGMEEGTSANVTEKFVLPCIETLDSSEITETTSQNYPIFRNLKEVVVISCGNLQTLFPASLAKHLEKLEKLKIQGCHELQAVVKNEEGTSANMTEKFVLPCIETLDSSEITETTSQNYPIFRNLKEVVVRNCGNLQTLFPASLAKNLKELEKLEIVSCHKLLAIVGMEEGTSANVTEKFVFPCLESLDLRDLPQVTYFYPQTFTLECPALNKLVSYGHELELFPSAHPKIEGEASSSSNRQPLFSNLKAISNLKELVLDWKHISALRLWFKSAKFMEGLNHLEKIILFCNNKNEKHMIPIEIILRQAPNLIEMRILRCDSPEIFLAENPDNMLGQLKKLTLRKVSALKSMELEDSSWLNTICGKLHELNVEICPELKRLVHTDTVSFSCLKKVSIWNCPKLQYLFTSSAARKLMKLEEITVKKCESVTEIVAKEGDASNEGIQFEQLNTIVLHSLSSLTCFYSGNDILCLSSLINVHVWKCPHMKIFSQGVIHAERFRGIQISLDPNENQDLLFHQDLTATVETMFQRQGFFEAVDKQYFSKDLFGNVGLQNKWLCNLTTLKLVKCTLQYAIPLAILPYLKNLGELEVRDSDKVKVIFDMNDPQIMETMYQLKKLTLLQLSSLEHVWEKNSHQVLVFHNLQEVIVHGCENLQTLFPASLAKNLEKLEKLEVKYCDELQEIVQKEESTEADITEKFVFPWLEKLHLYCLSQLTCFYPQIFTLECPSLSSLHVWDCDELDLFGSAHPTDEGEGGSTTINRQPLISNLKDISMLKELKLDWKHIWALTLRFRSEEFSNDLKYLEKIFLGFYTDENEKAMFPIEILQKAPNIIKMRISDFNAPEIFLDQSPKIVGKSMLGQLTKLKLWKVSALQSMVSEDSSWLNTTCGKLQKLDVDECPDLTTLVHTETVSFSCLKKVSIWNCPQLQYLFTSSAARKLMNLEEITVFECDSVKEIVAKGSKEVDEDEHKGEGEDKHKNEMIFRKLQVLKLYSLPQFESFYTGSLTLNFLSLKEVWLNKCDSVKVFRCHDKLPENLKVAIDGNYREVDIHSVIMQQPVEEAV